MENLEFRQSTYLLLKEEYPENPNYSIVCYYPNPYYGKENEYQQDDLGWCYKDGSCSRIHKSCFEGKENCLTIAVFYYDEHDERYEFRFVGDNPLCLDEDGRKVFWELIRYGFENLNKNIKLN